MCVSNIEYWIVTNSDSRALYSSWSTKHRELYLIPLRPVWPSERMVEIIRFDFYCTYLYLYFLADCRGDYLFIDSNTYSRCYCWTYTEEERISTNRFKINAMRWEVDFGHLSSTFLLSLWLSVDTFLTAYIDMIVLRFEPENKCIFICFFLVPSPHPPFFLLIRLAVVLRAHFYWFLDWDALHDMIRFTLRCFHISSNQNMWRVQFLAFAQQIPSSNNAEAVETISQSTFPKLVFAVFAYGRKLKPKPLLTIYLLELNRFNSSRNYKTIRLLSFKEIGIR